MHRLAATIAAAVVGIAAGGCGTDNQSTTRSSSTVSALIPRPVVERELDALLLTAAQINPLVGASELAIAKKRTAMSDDSATMRPPECLAIDGSAQAQVYANSGFTAVRDEALNDGNAFTHYAEQAVVLFATVRQAKAFVAASGLRWPACHEYRHTQSGTQWTVGPVADDDDDVLSTISTQQHAKAGGWACGRALTVVNNVVVDVNTCSANPANSAVDVARQIVAKVAAR